MSGMDMTGMDMSGMSSAPKGLLVSQDGYTVNVRQAVLPADRPVALQFTIDGPDGRPVTGFSPHMDKLLHLIVVRRDLGGFQHLHPTMAPDGAWTQPLTLPGPGSYRAYMQFVTDTRELTLGVDLAAPGDYQPQPLPAVAAVAEVDGFEVAMAGTPRAGQDHTATFHITRGGAPVTALQPYLGAMGHLTALRVGDMAFLHIHPRIRPGTGPDVVFSLSSPPAGTYRVYFQFQVDGVVHTAEFTVPIR